MFKQMLFKGCAQVVRVCFVIVFGAISLAGITFLGLIGYHLIF